MAGFCENCGRPLADGEVCNCVNRNAYRIPNTQTNMQQNFNQPTTAAAQSTKTSEFVSQTKNAIGEFIPVIKHPVTKTQELASSGNSSVGIAGMIAKMAVYVLMIAILWNKLIDFVMDIDYFYKEDDVIELLEELGLSLPKLILFAVLLTVGYDLLKALLLKVFTLNVCKGNTSLSEMITVVGVQSIFSAMLLLVAMLVSLMATSWGIGACVLMASAVAVVGAVCYASVAPGDKDKKLYAYMIVSVIMAVAAFVVFRLFFADIMSNCKEILNELF